MTLLISMILNKCYHIKMKLTAVMPSLIKYRLFLFFLKGNLACHFLIFYFYFLLLVFKMHFFLKKNINKKHVQREKRKNSKIRYFFKLVAVQKSVTIYVTILIINKVLFSMHRSKINYINSFV